jgi:RNA polymerase sigma-70 factor, ECF subfamily
VTDESKHWCESLYEERAAQILLYGRSLGLSHSEAEDVLQETFVALMQLASVPEKPLHYCLRSFRNRALNYRRGFLRRMARELESTRWFERDPDESPEERAAMQCLERLPKDQREVILLKIWHEYTFEEIGELLEISPNTAAGRYRYGLQKMKSCLKKESYERFESRGETITLLDAAPTISGS